MRAITKFVRGEGKTMSYTTNRRLHCLKTRRANQGFTLIELMIVVLVMAAALVIGVPSFTSWIKDTKLETTTRTFAAALKEARSEAVSRQSVINLNKKAGGWKNGFTMYTDADIGGNTNREATDVLIKDIDISPGGVTITPNTAGNNWISFTPQGLLNEAGKEVIVGICDDRGKDKGYEIKISIVGRTTVKTATDCTP